MNGQERRDLSMRVTGAEHELGDAHGEEWRHRRRFTANEWQRLVFMRWLYRRGRLTEYPATPASGPRPWGGTGNGR